MSWVEALVIKQNVAIQEIDLYTVNIFSNTMC